MHEKNKKNGIIGSTFLTFLCIFWIMPVFIVLWNSFKNKNSINLQPFQLPSNETFVGWENYGAAIGRLDSIYYGIFSSCDSVILQYVRMVYNTSKDMVDKNDLRFVPVQYGCSISDGYVYIVTCRKYVTFNQSFWYHNSISGIWRRTGNIYVHWLCSIHSY